MSVRFHQIQTSDKVTLSVREYAPAESQDKSDRVLLLLHGVGEHGGRYENFAQAACERGWRVVIPDHRGHGLSTGRRVFARSLDDYVTDLRQIATELALPTGRIFLVGHSFGGLLSAYWIRREAERFAGAVLLSPAFGVRLRISPWTWWMGRSLVGIWPGLRIRSGIKAKHLTHDETRLQERRADTLIQRFVTLGWFFAMLRAQRELWSADVKITSPLLGLQGTDDPIVDPEASRRWFQEHTVPPSTCDMLPEHLHELLQEPDQAAITARILDWCATQFAAVAGKFIDSAHSVG